MMPLRPPSDEEAFKGQLSAANKKVVELLEGDLSKYTDGASKLLDDYSAVDLVAALLKDLSKDSESIKVKITPEKPLPFKGKHGSHRGNRRSNRSRSSNNRNHNSNRRNSNSRGGKRKSNHEFVIKKKK